MSTSCNVDIEWLERLERLSPAVVGVRMGNIRRSCLDLKTEETENANKRNEEIHHSSHFDGGPRMDQARGDEKGK